MPITLVFDEVRLEVLASATQGGPEASTTIISNPFSGLSQRNVNRYDKLHRYEINFGLLTPAELNELRTFFHCRDGMARGFRFLDYSEFWASADGVATAPVATPMQFGTGNGTATVFGLCKRYVSGGVTRERRIVKPVSGTVSIYKNNVMQTPTTDYTLDHTTGIVTFTSAPANGHSLKWTGEFDVPVYFGADWFAPNLGDALTDISYSSLPVVEIPASAFNLEV